MKTFFEYVNQIYFPKELSSEDMIAYLRKNHDTNLHQDYIDNINTFVKFVLKSVPLSNIKTDLSGLDQSKVEQYKKWTLVNLLQLC